MVRPVRNSPGEVFPLRLNQDGTHEDHSALSETRDGYGRPNDGDCTNARADPGRSPSCGGWLRNQRMRSRRQPRRCRSPSAARHARRRRREPSPLLARWGCDCGGSCHRLYRGRGGGLGRRDAAAIWHVLVLHRQHQEDGFLGCLSAITCHEIGMRIEDTDRFGQTTVIQPDIILSLVVDGKIVRAPLKNSGWSSISNAPQTGSGRYSSRWKKMDRVVSWARTPRKCT